MEGIPVNPRMAVRKYIKIYAIKICPKGNFNLSFLLLENKTMWYEIANGNELASHVSDTNISMKSVNNSLTS
jgi:hypothetical protein